MEHLHEPLVRIAPESKDHFNEAFPDFLIEYLDDSMPILNVTVEDKHIRISSGMVEFVWATALAHFVIYQNYFANKKSKGGDAETIKDEHAPVMNLLKWAIKRIINRDSSPWPEDLPRPSASAAFASDEHVADEFTLGACACMIHHELAHITLGHAEESNIDIEKAADNTSWEWVIPSPDLPDKVFTKRILMIIHAFLIPVTIDIHAGQFRRTSHPASFERLSNAIEKFSPGENSMGYAFAVSVLSLHLSNANSGITMPPQKIPHHSFKEAFDSYMDYFVQFVRSA